MTHSRHHCVVYYDPTRWAAVPANNGGNGPTWQWGDEILVGFTRGTYSDAKPGHQCSYDYPFESWLARSTDGGETWTVTSPEPYAGQGLVVAPPPGGLDFTGPGFVMRVEGNGYHGNQGAQWFASDDRGATWHGPFGFGGLLDQPELAGLEFTSRTAYLVNGPGELRLFMSARHGPEANPLQVVYDRSFLARTTDSGATFSFVTWIVSWEDAHRAVMPAPVRISPRKLVVALRRKSSTGNWIDCFVSTDNGSTWAFLSKVANTENQNEHNGNPPALVCMADGRLCCVYGNRSRRQIIATISDDEGATWGPKRVLRDDFRSANSWPDLGYCRLYQRRDGCLVTVYFWCTPERPQTHIEATLFWPW